jgi:SagB-type dehydrogenase family enzyme
VFLDDPTIKAVAHYVNGKLEEQGRATGSLDADVRADGKVETAVQQPNMEKADIHDNGEIKSDVISRLMGFLSGISGLERIKAEDDLFDIGATSLTMAQMVEIIQKNYNVTVPVEVILEEPSINTIAAYVAEKARISDIQRSDVKKEPVEGNIRPVKVPIESAGDTQKIIELNKAVFKESAYQKGRFGRNYVEKFIPFGLFSSFLSLLRRETIDREPKYLHPTAGGLNAVQTYIFIKENSIEGFERGVYYYHPEEHALYLIHDTPQIDGDIFFEYDRPFFYIMQVLCCFFIAQLDAITPVYQGVSPSLVAIDAGYMGQLLLDRQSEFGMGVCPVVGVDFDRIASFFKLDKGHKIHSLHAGRYCRKSFLAGRRPKWKRTFRIYSENREEHHRSLKELYRG